MTEEQDKTVKPSKKTIKVPDNYYYYGDPARVIDRVDQLAKLDGDPQFQEQRQQLAREVLSFCPVPFLDELVAALELRTQEATEALKNKASRQEIVLPHLNLSEGEKNPISNLALQLLNEKIMNADAEQLLPILRLIQTYIKRQLYCEDSATQKIERLKDEKKRFDKAIEVERTQLVSDQQAIFIDFAGKLSNLDF
jgi:hypothetical protein